MRIKLTSDIQCASTGLKFFKNKTYSATPASNQPGWARLGKKNGLILKKIFVSKAKNPEHSLLIESADFEIVDFPEKQEIQESYEKSKIREPKVKVLPDNIREGFNFMTDEQKNDPDLNTCGMGKGGQKGVLHELCGRPSNFVKVLTPKVSIGRCSRCACK